LALVTKTCSGQGLGPALPGRFVDNGVKKAKLPEKKWVGDTTDMQKNDIRTGL